MDGSMHHERSMEPQHNWVVNGSDVRTSSWFCFLACDVEVKPRALCMLGYALPLKFLVFVITSTVTCQLYKDDSFSFFKLFTYSHVHTLFGSFLSLPPFPPLSPPPPPVPDRYCSAFITYFV
jgi:hypothetical protein